MFNILSHQGNANQNHPNSTPHTSQTKTQIRSKTQVTVDVGEDVEKEEHSIVGGLASWYSCCGNQSGNSSENWT